MIQAIYTFKDATSEFHVFKHKDGSPYKVYEWLKAIQVNNWAHKLPRFEPAEFAAAFIRAVKQSAGGDVRLLETAPWETVCPLSARYHYTVTATDQYYIEVDVIYYHVGLTGESPPAWFSRQVFAGTLDDFGIWAPKDRDGT